MNVNVNLIWATVAMATCGAILLPLGQRVTCTLPHNHDGIHSFELVAGKRTRKASKQWIEHQDDGGTDDSDVPKKAKKAKKATSGGGASTSSGATWAPPPPATWQITVPKKIKIPAGLTPFSAEVKFMSLSNAKVSGTSEGSEASKGYRWGGNPNFTPTEKEAIAAVREDGDNINTLVFCCLDPLTGDIYIYAHNVDADRVYDFGNYTFKALVPKEYPKHGFGIPPRHRSNEAIQAWIAHMEAWCGTPPVAVLHLNRAGVQDDCFDDARPVLAPNVLHLYGLCDEDGDSRMVNARKFLSTRASIFNKPGIGDNFLETFKGTESMAKVKAFLNLFVGASNKAIGSFGEAITVDILLASGAAP